MLDLSALSIIYVGEDFSPLTFDGTAEFASEKKKATVAREIISMAFNCYFQETPRIAWIR